MSASEKVSTEVSELLEMVCGKSAKSDKNEDTSVPAQNEKPIPIPSENIQVLENIVIHEPNVDVKPKIVPMTIDGGNIHSTNGEPPTLELRAIESNALKMIAQYGSDSDSSEYESETESSDDVVEVVLEKTIADGNYRVISSDSEESSSSDDSDCEVISIQNEVINLDDYDLDESSDKPKGPIRAEGEFTIDSLPPIEDLKISVREDECVVLGKVISIVDQLVVVDSLKGSLPLDIDSVLFLDKGTKPLGHVFDVLGNISSPMYCVRFNSNQQIQEKGITVGELVYVAPRTEYTSFVIVSELMKQKGCDASWKNDIESQNAMDFSDDEEERKARRMRRGRDNSGDNESLNTQTNANQRQEYGNSRQNSEYRTPRRRGRGRGRGGSYQGRNYGNGNQFPSPSNHSWHHNLHSAYQNAPTPFSNTFLLPPPPPPPLPK